MVQEIRALMRSETHYGCINGFGTRLSKVEDVVNEYYVTERLADS